ncbi:DivIVA domain-containing protein [Actinokineospora sp. NBRC 105648]|uniref:DivIVA domain-containing protein n=1 Tax=Actinokineospora sp. NBRC 105648 TaxID=3032206 RepID=UPI0024A3333C|nr:DivIVA domain-containing protein [Actinokineospora sp. NBRC 105648]GLZ39809.1 hypothetical protein Acsp05_34330 [Actinokineospora sp. NBRC 105648]
MTLTPDAVRAVTFDKAPFGRRGYHEDQVDDFLDRVEAALSGRGDLTVQDVREAEFDAAPLVKRGYHEDQVDEFLDDVAAALEHRAATTRPRPTEDAEPPATPRTRAASHAQPDARATTDSHGRHDSRDQAHAELPTARQATRGTQPDHHGAIDPHGPQAELPEPPYFPLPPAPPGTQGYHPADVERLAHLLDRAAIEHGAGPTAEQVAATRLTLSPYPGQGYHPAAVDAIKSAWLTELRRRER